MKIFAYFVIIFLFNSYLFSADQEEFFFPSDQEEFEIAVKNRDSLLMRQLLDTGRIDVNKSMLGRRRGGWGCPLHIASESLDDEMIKLLICYNADVNIRGEINRETALHLIVSASSYDKLPERHCKGLQCLLLLLNAGAKKELVNQAGLSPLAIAAQGDVSKSVELLMVDDMNHKQKALEHAIQASRVENIVILLLHGVKITDKHISAIRYWNQLYSMSFKRDKNEEELVSENLIERGTQSDHFSKIGIQIFKKGQKNKKSAFNNLKSREIGNY